MGDPPDVAQLIGSNLAEWADRGLVLPLSGVAARQNWSQTLFPKVDALVRYKNDVIAVPLGIHRINSLFYSRRVFERFKLKPPRTWADFDAVARTLKAAGVTPLAWSDEAWQIATVFESLLLSEAGPALYLELVTQRNSAAWLDPRVEKALQRLRWLRNGTGEREWTASARDLQSGAAAMMIMGDWVNGELMAWGADPTTDFSCIAVPGTEHMHLYSVDTLAMLVNARHPVALQEKMAEILQSRPLQLAYNRIKGSVSVRKDLSATQLNTMDSCARDSWETFAAPDTARVPSLAHRMAADESTKDAVAQTLWRYLMNPRMQAHEAQRRLASDIHTP
jgi:glucose/mannose transport system substrate-binding protein